MEVMIPDNFDFNSARSSPHVSPPSTPKRIGECYYYSAPTSPSHLSQFCRDSGNGSGSGSAHSGSSARNPFEWEEKPGTPKSPGKKTENFDFAFDVSEDWETASMSAEELFDGGMIKPLKPPPRLQLPAAVRVNEKKTSPRWKKPPLQKTKTKSDDPFLIAAQNAAKSEAPPERGRERAINLPNSTSRRAARSHSPLRDTQSLSKNQKKWSIKDFFLFRSASEGRAAEKDPLKKFTASFRHSSFRAVDSPGSRRKGPVSAHEVHYTVNPAVSEDLKKKTFLPYKQGILGRLAFNPAVHTLANGFGFSRK